MWKEFKISGKKYFMLLQINDETLDCVLYDGNRSWHEKQSLTIVLKRAKEFNKRIQFDETTIKETLLNETPNEAIWAEEDANEGCSDYSSLKLKYRVQSCPLNFTWHFCKQTEHDFQQFILFPLFRIVQGLTEQNDELREAVRKKDMEIVQYKTEGAKLKRKTLETQPFQFQLFNKKYAPTNALLKGINQISELLRAQFTPMQTPFKSVDDEDDDIKQDITKLTPRRRRRMILEEKERIIAEKMKISLKPLEYESSQSEQMSSSSQEVQDADKAKKAKTSDEKNSASNSVEVQSNQDKQPSVLNSSITQRDLVQDSTRSLRKRKTTARFYCEESSQSSIEEKVDVASPTYIPLPEKAVTSSVSEHISDDIKSIIDEWKALEQRRIADLNNIRRTRAGKCRST